MFVPNKDTIKGLLRDIEQSTTLVFNGIGYSYATPAELIANVKAHLVYLEDVIGNKHYCDNCQTVSYLHRHDNKSPWSCQNCGFIVGINLNS